MSDGVTAVTEALLRAMPLPRHAEGEDKDGRGRVLVIGGSVETPGGALLAGLAALRAGAGKLQVATVASLAPYVAVALPEGMVLALPETGSGSRQPRSTFGVTTTSGARGLVILLLVG